jgi:hypothetical protein
MTRRATVSARAEVTRIVNEALTGAEKRAPRCNMVRKRRAGPAKRTGEKKAP